MSLEEAFEIVTAAGYKISRPRATRAHDPQRIIETNPLGHAFPHAKLKNVSLTSITRLNKFSSDAAWRSYSSHMTA